jgi:peroxiredoxin Q/BCP
MGLLQKGRKPSDISLPLHTGETVALEAFRKGRPMVVFFYPKSGTPVCTKEACGFRDAHSDLEQLGAAVLGVSDESIEKHRSFAEKHSLPYPIASDRSGEIRKAFGVTKKFGILPDRVTFVLDGEGKVRHICRSQLDAGKHIEEAKSILNKISEEEKT